MEIPVEKITDEQAANVLGAVAAATIPDPPKKKSCIIRLPNRSASTVTSAPEADLISDLVHKIENLNESDAKARLFELEDAREKTQEITSICADFLVELRGLCAGRSARSNRCKSDAMKE